MLLHGDIIWDISLFTFFKIFMVLLYRILLHIRIQIIHSNMTCCFGFVKKRLFYYTLLFTKPNQHVIEIIYGRGKFVGDFNMGNFICESLGVKFTQIMFSHFWDRPGPIFSHVRFSFLTFETDQFLFLAMWDFLILH